MTKIAPEGGVAEGRYERLARIKRRQPSASVAATPAERLRIADAMIYESWRLAEAARASLDDAPEAPPWERFQLADARAHRQLQQRLRELQGCGQ